MKHCRIYACLLISLFCVRGMGQVIYPEPVKLPSIEAQSLGEFSETPVDLHTGRVNIEIPLYTIKYGDICVPISISYHGGGIKVTDESGAVGLGWTLNAGGVINRTLHGKPDEMADIGWKVYGYDKLTSLYATTDGWTGEDFHHFLELVKNNDLEVDPALMLNDPDNYQRTNEFAQLGYMYDEGHFDASPDSYSFSVLGHSGTFFNKDHNIILQANTGCSVLPDRGGYVISDKDGLIYDFCATERQLYPYRTWFKWEQIAEESQNQRLQEYKYISSWWLSCIRSLAGDSVTFTYVDATVLHNQPTHFGYYQRETFNEQNYVYTISIENRDPYERNDTSYHKILKVIESPLCKVVFTYKENNLLIYPKLERMSVYAKNDLEHPIESYEFCYSGNYARSLLTKIVHVGSSGDSQTYEFSYQTRYGIEFSLSQRDHWGYYAPSSTGRFPLRCSSYDYPILGGRSYHSERFANDSTADNCMLTSIKYPSGLTAKLIWEPNDFFSLSYVGQHALYEENYNNVEIEQVLTEQSRSVLCGKSTAEHLSESFILNEMATLSIDMTHYYETAKNPGSAYHECIMEWNTEEELMNRAKLGLYRGSTLIHEYYLSDYTSNVITENLAPGNYTIRLVNPRNMIREDGGVCRGYYEEFFDYSGVDERPDGYIYITCNKSRTQISSNQARSVGGVRIKEIKYQSGSKTLLHKQYSYVQPDGVTSSGVLSFPPRYYSYHDVYESKYVQDPDGGAPAYKTSGSKCLIMSSNGLPSTLNSGSHIEYSRVIESNISSGRCINRVIHDYTTALSAECSDIVDFDTHQLHAIPSSMLQLTSRNYLRGDEVSAETISDEILHVEREYDVLEQYDVDTIYGSIYPFADYEKTGLIYSGSVKPYKNYGMVYYRLIPYNKRIKRINYNGSKSGRQTELYEYANTQYSSALNANLPIVRKTLSSEGDTIVEHYSYLPNSSRISSYVKAKKSPACSVEHVVDAYRIDHDSYNHPVSRWVADLQQESLPTTFSDIEELASDLTETCSYYKNRIVEKKDIHTGISSVILWSYANSYPIAEIENATWEQVVSLLGIDVLSRLFSAIVPDMSVVNSLRERLADCKVRTFTYKPLIGIDSSTDENGITTYYDYDGFGNLSEIYLIENGNKKILQHLDYHWNN